MVEEADRVHPARLGGAAFAALRRVAVPSDLLAEVEQDLASRLAVAHVAHAPSMPTGCDIFGCEQSAMGPSPKVVRTCDARPLGTRVRSNRDYPNVTEAKA